MMNRTLLLTSFLALMLLSSCTNRYKAVYLSAGAGELSNDDLKAHPEVFHTQSFDDFKSHAGSRTALWIDKNAVSLVDSEWLKLRPQRHYPLVVVGYNDPLYCFRETLPIGQIEGPYVDWSKETLEPGFCVWMITKEFKGGHSSHFRGYPQAPKVQDILDVTNVLLEEKQEISIPTPEASATVPRQPDGIDDDPAVLRPIPGGETLNSEVTNSWRKTTPDRNFFVYAGFIRDDSQQGMVLWQRPNRIFMDRFLTPTKSGAVRILEERNLILILQAENGDVFYFDALGGRFVDSPDAATVTPLPTPPPPIYPYPDLPKP